jgi:hypothetical protein
MTDEEAQSVASLYVYGIVSADGAIPPDLTGVQGAPVQVVVARGVGAVVSDLQDEDALGLPADLVAHGAVLDRLAADAPVLPMTFGTVVPDEDDLVDRVLNTGAEDYLAALDRLDGAQQFSLRARYVEETVLRELVEENPEIARLREATADTTPEESHFERIRLGELVVGGMSAKARADADTILAAVLPLARDSSIREPGRPDDVVDVALLVGRGAEPPLERAIGELAARHTGRIEYRLLGPQAPYDFVGGD